MDWFNLALAILFEVGGTTMMKFTAGFTRLMPSTAVVVLYVISTVFMNLAVRSINLGVVYAIWSGVGTAAITLISFWFFQEPLTLIKIGSIVLIVLGVVGLNLGGGHGN
ncbi:MAG TPA: multidrug efflux SMR transporter [Anaerolineaceae bacterium]